MTARMVRSIAISAALLVLFALTAWSWRGHHVPYTEVIVIGIVLAIVAVLPTFRPRSVTYAFGVGVLALAFGSFWIRSPTGIDVLARANDALGSPASHTLISVASWIVWLGFPLAWVLLAASVWGWRHAVASYAIAGLAFVGILAMSRLPPVPPVWFIAWVIATWPQFALTILGVFGSHFD